MDIKVQFNNNLVDLIKVLKKNNKSSKDLLNKYYKYYTSLFDTKFIIFVVEFNSLIKKYNNDIINADEMLFSNDVYKGGIYLFKDIDFKLLWKNLNDEDKNIVWKKLKILYTLSLHILKTTTEYKELYEKQKSIMAKIVDELTNKHNIEEEAKRQEEEERALDQINFEDLRSKFGDNIFTDIIIEIIKELNIDKNLDASTLINLVKDFSNKGDKNPLIENIIDKVKKKLEERNMTEAQLYEELAKVKERFNDFFKGMPQFTELIDKLTSEAKNIVNKKLNPNEVSNDSNQDPSNSKESSNPLFNGFETEMNMLKDITSKIEEFGLSGILNEIQNITFDNNGNIVSKE